MNLTFPAQVTAVKLFKLTQRKTVNLGIYSSGWNSAKLHLTVDRGDGVSHAVYPITDITTPFVADPFIIQENWDNDIVLGAGEYGFTVDTGTPSSPIVVSVSGTGRGLGRGDNFETYG